MSSTLLENVPALLRGAHKVNSGSFCVMEAVAYVAGEPWSDTPQCACPVIGAFLRSWNDSLDDAQRDTLLRPLVLQVVGTRATEAIERRRAVMSADWYVRTFTPAWLRLAGLSVQADTLASLPEITDLLQCPYIMPALNAVRDDASAAWSAARSAAWSAARSASWAAAWSAASAESAAESAAWSAAWSAASSAAESAAWSALEQTRNELQQSAIALVERMIAVKE
jgi:hypothetical protein